MRTRSLALTATLAALITVVSWASVRVAGQAAQPTTKAPAAPAKKTGPPRTPWGDPDISGNFTNVYEQATPLERPDDLKGRSLDEIKGKELSDLLGRRRDRQLQNFDEGSDVHAPTFWWADSLAVEKGGQAWFIVDPPEGKMPPRTQEAQERAAARAAARRASGRGPADSWEDRSYYDRCISRGLPGSMMPAIYGNSYQIVQSKDAVAIRYEMVHETRIIPLDGRPHVASAIRQFMGDGRGHWEGDVLVVETTNFNDKVVYQNANPDTLKLVERFQRVAPNRVQWTVTVEDPKTWTRPWTFTMPLTEDDQEAIFEYACHEGNLGLRNILSGARADEKAVEDAAKKGIKLAPTAIPTGGEAER